MGHRASINLAILLLVLTACSDKNSDQNKTTPAPVASTPAQPASTPSLPPNHPPMGTEPALQQPANQNPGSGKVLKAMHAGGYTYMQVEIDGKEVWIASTMMNVKRDDRVSWTDAAVMKNFTSSTLRRTFDEILFVSKASINQ